MQRKFILGHELTQIQFSVCIIYNFSSFDPSLFSLTICIWFYLFFLFNFQLIFILIHTCTTFPTFKSIFVLNKKGRNTILKQINGTILLVFFFSFHSVTVADCEENCIKYFSFVHIISFIELCTQFPYMRPLIKFLFFIRKSRYFAYTVIRLLVMTSKLLLKCMNIFIYIICVCSPFSLIVDIPTKIQTYKIQ